MGGLLGGKTFDTICPRTEEVLTTVQEASNADVDKAVEAATKAFATFKKATGTCDATCS